MVCSGLRYCAVPSSRPVEVSRVPSTRRAMPKSVSLVRSGVPSSAAQTITFAGFTSRWMTPASWIAWSEAASCPPSDAACRGSSGPRRISWARVSPSTSSITRNGCSSCVPMS